jgi:hypothetical protein
LTDLPSCLDMAKTTVRRSFDDFREQCTHIELRGSAIVEPLSWGDSEAAQKLASRFGGFDLLVGSDLCWQEEHVRTLRVYADVSVLTHLNSLTGTAADFYHQNGVEWEYFR